MRIWPLVVLAACHGSSSENPPEASIAQCGGGDTIVTRKIAYACGSPFAPAAPGCMQGGLTLVTSPPNDGRMFVLEQQGRIRIITEDERVVGEPFLDLSADRDGPVVAGGELGLLGLAFHPQFATNHFFYVFYTTTGTTTQYSDVVVRFTANGDTADPASATPILAIPDKYSNHNGGMIEFGSDGLLYISTGDGGSANDPDANGQNTNALLAKILRIDVDGGSPYAIPASNPFGNEVFVYGLRNAWRWSFDRANGDMWIGDVGQGEWEELDVLPAGHQLGANLGWNMYEAQACFHQPCSPANRVFPLDSRNHSTGWNAIIGGQVYRGSCYPGMTGWYFYTDNGYGHMSKARLKDDGTLEIVDLPGDFPGSPSSLHEGSHGELYETDTAGNVFRVEARP